MIQKTEPQLGTFPFAFRLNRPLLVKRRTLLSPDPMTYAGELVTHSRLGHTGYGEVVNSRQLAHEMAELDLQSRLTGKSIPELLGRPVLHENISVAWMYPSVTSPLPLSTKWRGDLQHVGSCFKFKIGSDWAFEAEQLIELRKNIGPDTVIRLDANQSMSLEDAVQFGKRIASVGIAYFEEPLKDPASIPVFTDTTGIPVALDESLNQPIQIPHGVTTLALKPFMMPDLKTIFYWIDLANERGLDLVISSCFESALGISWLVILAGIANPKLLPAGLSTYRWFEENFFTPEFSTSSAMAKIRTFQMSTSSEL